MSFSLAEVERALAVVRLRPEGATLAARVRPALAALGALIGPASQGSLSCSAVRRGRRGWSVSGPTVYTLWNMDEGLFEEYLAIYAAHDPSVPLFVQRPGQEVVASEILGSSALEGDPWRGLESPEFRGYCLACDLGDALGRFEPVLEEGVALQLTLFAPRDVRFDPRDARLLGAVIPDVLTTARLALALERSATQRASDRGGVATHDSAGRLLQLDPGAQAALDDVVHPRPLEALLGWWREATAAQPSATATWPLRAGGGLHLRALRGSWGGVTVLEREGAPAETSGLLAGLTPREAEVASRAARGLTNPQLAEALALSRQTVKRHLAAVYRKLGVSGRVELGAALLGVRPFGGRA